MAPVPVPPPPLLASHAAVRAAASAVSRSRRARRGGDQPPQVAALRRGDWVKLICGASFEDAADVRNLSLVYTLAGVDCIDCAADASVVGAVNEGINVAASIIPAVQRPWVMVSVNDDCRDLHFRKAEFDPEDCPQDCSKPCEKVCPADAISLESVMVGGEHTQSDPLRGKLKGGVLTERCYGCGRCLPVCPYDRIRAVSYVRDPTTTCELLKGNDVDAIEIHTTGKGTDTFNTLWNSLSESINNVKLVAVSMPDIGESTVDFMNALYAIMEPHIHGYNLWQLDGRPMSGDIGRGATRETVSFAVHMASVSERPPGFYQLAGGTNSYTIDCLKKAGLFQSTTFRGTTTSEMIHSQQALIGGIAYGGYARKIIGRTLRKIPAQFGRVRIEDHPEHLLEALQEALSLVGPVKSYPALSSLS
ncbi:hypothetical protein PAHAL_3G128200 [Panicum hallii]|uniref:4Fe-4S ferredoxin-type domain-containing protein n=1 Tax=Panicum hallii TaxID=206008 RepID=A0A2S3H8C8_9POAL|nr:uncharacterized protein LOC112884061 [Panicum hallii]PAN17388.1 hypothetical protein PAHAL_3G128200 [Panicum hallii]